MTMLNRSMGSGWKKKLADNAARKAALNDPELLARRAETAARLEAERHQQARIEADAEARRAAEMVVFPPMPPKIAAEIMMAFERFRAAGREATPAETEAVSLISKGLPVPASFPVVRATHGLPSPVAVSGAVPPVETKAVAPTVEKLVKAPKPAKVADDNTFLEDGALIEV